jgi:hypothetical protein
MQRNDADNSLEPHIRLWNTKTSIKVHFECETNRTLGAVVAIPFPPQCHKPVSRIRTITLASNKEICYTSIDFIFNFKYQLSIGVSLVPPHDISSW